MTKKKSGKNKHSTATPQASPGGSDAPPDSGATRTTKLPQSIVQAYTTIKKFMEGQRPSEQVDVDSARKQLVTEFQSTAGPGQAVTAVENARALEDARDARKRKERRRTKIESKIDCRLGDEVMDSAKFLHAAQRLATGGDYADAVAAAEAEYDDAGEIAERLALGSVAVSKDQYLEFVFAVLQHISANFLDEISAHIDTVTDQAPTQATTAYMSMRSTAFKPIAFVLSHSTVSDRERRAARHNYQCATVAGLRAPHRELKRMLRVAKNNGSEMSDATLRAHAIAGDVDHDAPTASDGALQAAIQAHLQPVNDRLRQIADLSDAERQGRKSKKAKTSEADSMAAAIQAHLQPITTQLKRLADRSGDKSQDSRPTKKAKASEPADGVAAAIQAHLAPMAASLAAVHARLAAPPSFGPPSLSPPMYAPPTFGQPALPPAGPAPTCALAPPPPPPMPSVGTEPCKKCGGAHPYCLCAQYPGCGRCGQGGHYAKDCLNPCRVCGDATPWSASARASDRHTATCEKRVPLFRKNGQPRR